MKVNIQNENVLYALHYEGKLLGTFKWSELGPDGLHGWRPPKKIYFKLGQARNGAGHLPKDVIDKIEIVRYLPEKIVEKCSSKEREFVKLTNELKRQKRIGEHYREARDDYYINLIKKNEQKVKELEEQIAKLK